jgi:hypothetical protein
MYRNFYPAFGGTKIKEVFQGLMFLSRTCPPSQAALTRLLAWNDGMLI